MRRAALHMLHGQAAAGLHTAAFTGAKNRLSTVRIDMNTSHVEQIDHLDQRVHDPDQRVHDLDHIKSREFTIQII